MARGQLDREREATDEGKQERATILAQRPSLGAERHVRESAAG